MGIHGLYIEVLAIAVIVGHAHRDTISPADHHAWNSRNRGPHRPELGRDYSDRIPYSRNYPGIEMGIVCDYRVRLVVAEAAPSSPGPHRMSKTWRQRGTPANEVVVGVGCHWVSPPVGDHWGLC